MSRKTFLGASRQFPYNLKMLHWLVAGIGDITTKRALPAILSESRSVLHAVLTRNPEKAAAYPNARVYATLDAALADPLIDAVYIGLPVALHAPTALAAFRAGKHVLCEKPVAMNYTEARSLVDAANAAKLRFGVSYYRRMYPKLRRAVELLNQGVIGRPLLAEAHNHFWFDEAVGPRNWFLNPAFSGGGPLYDIASHRIDLFNFLFGNPVRVCGQISNVIHPRAVEDSATVLIEYEQGTRCMVDVRWHSKIGLDDFRITGTEGVMDLSPLNSPNLTYPGGDEQQPAPTNLHYPCVENFVSAVQDGTPLASSGASAIVTDWVTKQVLDTNPQGRFRYHR